jgi:hypothetical protein
MKYQFVLQWSTHALIDFDVLVAVEDLLISKLTERSIVDGHDYGSDEANIFILTDDPQETFNEVRKALSGLESWADVRIGYRPTESSQYCGLWPPGMTMFRGVIEIPKAQLPR